MRFESPPRVAIERPPHVRVDELVLRGMQICGEPIVCDAQLVEPRRFFVRERAHEIPDQLAIVTLVRIHQ